MRAFDMLMYSRLNDVDHGAKSQAHLNDLRDRAEYLGQKTGTKPVSWYEYKQSQPAEESHTIRNLLIGAAIGVGIGLVAALVLTAAIVPLAIGGALFGAVLGGFSDTENTRRDAQVKKYENYLDGFEASVGRERAVSQQVDNGIATKTTHAAEVLASRQKEQQPSVGV